MLVEIAIEGAVGKVDLFLLTEVAAEFGESPMGLARQGRIVHEGKDYFGDNMGFELPTPTTSGTVDESVYPKFVET